MATEVSKSEFAKIYGCSKAYVSQLVAAGRIVLTEDGKRVQVEATFELLGVTADPSKAGVRERWAAYRAGEEFSGTATAAAPPPAGPVASEQLALETEAPAAAPAPTPAAEPRSSAYHDARTLREQSQAQMAQLELRKQLGSLLEAEPVMRAVVDVHTRARTELLQLPDRLAQLVAPEIDPRRCYDLIQAECERICQRLASGLRELGATDPAAS